MISLVLKYWKLLLDILIVIALCVAFSYFDPFHIFRKAELKQTANLVSGIKAIGELVTAEYYGEVISYEGDTLKLAEDGLTDSIRHFYRLMVAEIDLIPADTRRKDLPAAMGNVIIKLKAQSTKFYPWFVAFIAHKYNDKRFEKYVERLSPLVLKSGADADLYGDIREQLLKKRKQLEKAYSPGQAIENYNAYLDELPDYLDEFYDFYTQQNFSGKKDNAGDAVILIARGTVKAGFNFGVLDERNFIYDKSKKHIHLYGINAQMLDTIINPWFIPEQKVPGYDFVNNPKTSDYSEVLAVKTICRDKLARRACEAGVLEQAQQNGHDVLQNFFAVLLNEPGLTISFNQMPGSETMNRITRDSIITCAEAQEFSQLLARYRLSVENAPADERSQLEFEQQILINQIKLCRFALTGKPFHLFNLAYVEFDEIRHNIAMVNDSQCIFQGDTVPYRDLVKSYLVYIRDTLHEIPLGRMKGYTTAYLQRNALWYADTSLSFKNDFNHSLGLFRQEYPEARNIHFDYPEFGFTESLYDTLGFTQTEQIDSVIEAILKQQQYVVAAEKNLIRQVECYNANYYIKSRPIKKFNKFIQMHLN